MSVQVDVLIISSEIMIANLLRMILESNYYRVVLAHNRNEAYKMLQVDTTDLILLDMKDSETNVVAAIKEIHHMVDAPLIVLSTIPGQGVTSRALQMGASAYFVKPFSARTLLDEVAKRISKK